MHVTKSTDNHEACAGKIFLWSVFMKPFVSKTMKGSEVLQETAATKEHEILSKKAHEIFPPDASMKCGG